MTSNYKCIRYRAFIDFVLWHKKPLKAHVLPRTTCGFNNVSQYNMYTAIYCNIYRITIQYTQFNYSIAVLQYTNETHIDIHMYDYDYDYDYWKDS